MKHIFSTTLFVLGICYSRHGAAISCLHTVLFQRDGDQPAYAGAHVKFSATAMYRNQWVNFPGAPKTFNISAHTALAKNKVGVGLMVNHDEIGSYSNDHIYLNYAYKIHFPNSTLAMGLQAGINLLGADYSKLDLQNPDDVSFYNISKQVKPNFGAGVFYTKKNFFLGFSIPFILNNEVANSVETILGGIKEARYYFLVVVLYCRWTEWIK